MNLIFPTVWHVEHYVNVVGHIYYCQKSTNEIKIGYEIYLLSEDSDRQRSITKISLSFFLITNTAM